MIKKIFTLIFICTLGGIKPGISQVQVTINEDNPRNQSKVLYGLDLLQMDLNGSGIFLKAGPYVILQPSNRILIRALAGIAYLDPDKKTAKKVYGKSRGNTTIDISASFAFAEKIKTRNRYITLKTESTGNFKNIKITSLELSKLVQWCIRGGYFYDQSQGYNEHTDNFDGNYPWLSSHSVFGGIGIISKKKYQIEAKGYGQVGFESLSNVFIDVFYSPSAKVGFQNTSGIQELSYKKAIGGRLVWEKYYTPQRKSYGLKFSMQIGGRPTPKEASNYPLSNIFFGGGLGIQFGYNKKAQ